MAKYLQDIRQGDSRTIRINYGAGYNITGWQFYFTMKLDIDVLANEVEVTTNVGDHVDDDALNGIVNIVVPASVTGALVPDSYYYSIKRTDGAGVPEIKTLLPPIEDFKDRLKVVKALQII